METKMSNTNTGGPAFPVKQYNRNIMAFEEVCGMTLRDYFAAKAMQAWLVGVNEPGEGRCADVAYRMADAMLKARDA
jgi:hypothetical protein